MKKETKKLLRKVAAVGGCIVLAGAGFGIGYGVADDSKEVANLKLSYSEKSQSFDALNQTHQNTLVELADSKLSVEDLNSTVLANELVLDEKDELITSLMSEDAQDAEWTILAEKEFETLSFKKKLINKLEAEGLVIDDRDDVSFSVVEVWEVVSDDSDREDGNAVLRSELRVKGFENGDKDEDFKRYFEVKVTIEEDEVMKVKLL